MLRQLWYMQALGASERVFELLDRKPQMSPGGHATPHGNPLGGEIELRNVWCVPEHGPSELAHSNAAMKSSSRGQMQGSGRVDEPWAASMATCMYLWQLGMSIAAACALVPALPAYQGPQKVMCQAGPGRVCVPGMLRQPRKAYLREPSVPPALQTARGCVLDQLVMQPADV